MDRTRNNEPSRSPQCLCRDVVDIRDQATVNGKDPNVALLVHGRQVWLVCKVGHDRALGAFEEGPQQRDATECPGLVHPRTDETT